MEKAAVMEIEDQKQSELNRFGDLDQQQKLTKRVLLKLDLQ